MRITKGYSTSNEGGAVSYHWQQEKRSAVESVSSGLKTRGGLKKCPREIGNYIIVKN